MATWSKAQRDTYWEAEMERARIIAEQYTDNKVPSGLEVGDVTHVFR